MQALPTQDQNRSGLLDALRGFALLGICVANAGYFSLYIFQTTAQKAQFPSAKWDRWLDFLLSAFVDGKFYSLFSLLFGAGFSIIIARQPVTTSNNLTIFFRRLLILAVLGLLHSFLLWDGDILFFYAITGAFLPLFRNYTNKRLVIISLLLLCTPLLFDFCKIITDNRWNISKPFTDAGLYFDQKAGIREDEIPQWLMQHTSYKNLLQWNRSGFWWGWQHRMDTNRLPKVLAMFLLGFCAGRMQLYRLNSHHYALIKKINTWTLLPGILASVAYAAFAQDGQTLPKPGGIWDTLFYALSVSSLSIGYATTLALIYRSHKKLLNWLEPMGQMALTNYIFQTIMGILFYYGFGVGIGGDKGPSFFIPVAILFFFIQAVYSAWWMKRFRFGPLEWIWRQLTYGKSLPLKKQQKSLREFSA